MAKHLEEQPSTDALQQLSQALAVLTLVLRNSHRKSAIKVRGGRTRARNAVRDARGRFTNAR
jgi:hypothetical protein